MYEIAARILAAFGVNSFVATNFTTEEMVEFFQHGKLRMEGEKLLRVPFQSEAEAIETLLACEKEMQDHCIEAESYRYDEVSKEWYEERIEESTQYMDNIRMRLAA